MRIIKHILVFLILLSALAVQSQNDYKNEDELIKDANSLFDSKDYAKAKPLFSQLVSLYPKNGPYNMKYGVCLLYDDKDKTKCLKYLKYAAGKSESGPESHYYYARGLHSNYDFNKAIRQYNKFKTSGNKKLVEEWQIDRQIEMCNNGKGLLLNVFDLNVIDKKEISRDEFFRIYDLGEIGGKLIVKPDEFKSKADLKSNETFLIHLPPDATVIYFSGYGDGKGNGKDIFRVRKKADNTWSEPENIGNVVNTPYDEDYPFMHPDGTLYFASKGHNSMGGYDLFKSEYNESTGTWSKPENLNFAISSSFDDLLFISDYKKQLAYFASSRSTTTGKLNVYRVQIARKPFDKAFLSGKFIAEGQSDVKSAKITIYDLESNQKIGTYFTDKETGKYNIGLPKGGKTYKFVVETDEDSPVHTGKVEVPVQNEMVGLKQEIRLVGAGDEQKLVIKNMFNETAPLDEGALASVLRTSGDLEVNTTEAEVMEAIANAPETEEPTTTQPAAQGIQEQHANIARDMEVLLSDYQKDLSDLQNQIAFGFKYSFEKAVMADQMYDQVEVLRQDVANQTDAGKKQSAVDKLMAQNDKLRPIASDAIVSYDFTKSLANEYDEKINDIEKLRADIGKVKGNASAGEEELQADINTYGPIVEDMKSMRSAIEIAPARYSDLLNKSKEKLARQEVMYKETRSDMESVKAEIDRLEKEIAGAKNKKAKDQMTEEKGSKEIDLQDLEFEFNDINKKYKKLQREVRNLEADNEKINDFISKMQANTSKVSNLSTDDQSELNKIIKFLKEQRMLDDVIAEDKDDLIASKSGSTDKLSSAQQYQATDNKGNPVNYEELYLVNLAAIELISDDEKRYTETAKLYENWANTVNEDIEIQENQLQYTEKKADKDLIEERIKILRDKEREYRQISVEYVEKSASAAAIASLNGGDGKSTNDANANSGTDADRNEGDFTVGGEKFDTQMGDIESLLVATIYESGPGDKNIDELNEAYEKAMEGREFNTDDPADEIALAAYELQWAKSIDELIEENEAKLEDPAYKADWPKIQQMIDEYEAEKKKHIENASGEFTAMQIDQQMGDEAVSLDDKYYIPFDPSKPDKEAYNAEYQALADAVENHQILSREEKDRELSMIHNYWSMTIQDDIIWHENEKTKLKTQAEINQLDNEIFDLNVDKKKHVNLSNEFYKKYKESKLYKDDLQKKEEKTLASAAGTGSASDAKTFDNYADVYAQESETRKSEISKRESDLEQIKSKGEKQQLGLELALMKRAAEDAELAQVELRGKGNAQLLSEEANKEILEDSPSWREEADNYVFSKKDFAQNVPESGGAYDEFKQAERSYERVQYLENQKQGILSSSIVQKDAESEVLRLQEEIDKEKLIAYEALARANKAQYASNKKEIDRLLELNPDIEKTNPRLYRDIKAADVIFAEVEKYRKNAEGFKSNSLKFDIYDQAQFMSEYVLTEQGSIIEALKGEIYTGELSFMAATEGDQAILDAQVENFEISRADVDRILTDPIFVEYEEDRRAMEEVKKERMQKEAEVQNEEKALKDIMDHRNEVVKQAYAQKGGKRKKLLKEAEVLDAELEEQQKKLDDVTLEMVQLKEQENNINRNSARLLKQADVDDRYKMVMLAELRLRNADESSYINEGEVVATTDETREVIETTGEALEGAILPGGDASTVLATGNQSVSNNQFSNMGTEIPQTLEGDLFITSASATVSPYSENKPIPIDAEIPTGLVFKVQVGAYRNPIPQDLFKGFAPLMGEKLDNGITRYTAGLFRDFGNANNAKNDIRKLGYDDAFVVAFYNGKRISFQELRNVENIDISLPPPVADNTFNGVPPEVLTTPSIIDDPGEVSSAIAEQTTNTKEVKGVFFAVQVGVYTNTVLPENLKVLRELNSELLPNGNIRYSVGQFRTLEEAQARRGDVQATVSDAFITAYSDGNRITVGEASNLINQVGQ